MKEKNKKEFTRKFESVGRKRMRKGRVKRTTEKNADEEKNDKRTDVYAVLFFTPESDGFYFE